MVSLPESFHVITFTFLPNFEISGNNEYLYNETGPYIPLNNLILILTFSKIYSLAFSYQLYFDWIENK